MRLPVCLAIDEKVIQQLNRHELRKSVSKSDIIRIAIHEFLEKSEKADKTKKEKGENKKA